MCLGPSKAPHTLGILVWVFFEPYPSPQCKEGPTRTHTLPPLETRLQCPGPQSSTFRVPAAIFSRSIFWRVDHTVSVHLRAQRIALCGQVWLELEHMGRVVHICSESSSRSRTAGAGKRREWPLPPLDHAGTMRAQEFQI